MRRLRKTTLRILAITAVVVAAIALAWCDAQLQGGERSRPPSDPFIQPR